MSQNELILAHLQAVNTLTHAEAMRKFGIGRLAARVEELRRRGHAISTEMAHEGSKQWAVYRMERAR